MNNSILQEKNGPVCKITLNRPDVLNSFDVPMGQQMQSALTACADDDSVRAVLITGAGRAFCAGQDLAEAFPPGQPPADIQHLVKTTYNPIIRLIRGIEKPVVCAVNGIAAGAGANLALACDFVLAGDKAAFLQAFIHIGLIPDSAGTYFLPRLVGLQRATAMMMLGEKISAPEAADIGLIYKSVPMDNLAEEADALASRLAGMATRGLGLTKKALNASLANDLEAQLVLEGQLQKAAAETEDYLEGVAAFMEKRRPDFKGK